MIRYILLFLILIPSVMAVDVVLATYKLIGLILLFSSIFIILGWVPLNVINKGMSDRLNTGEMMLAISIPAVISSLIQWFILVMNLLPIRTFIILIFFFNSFLYFFVYFKLRAKRQREHPQQPEFYRRY